MNPHPFHQKTIEVPGILICGGGDIGIKRGLDGAQEFFYRAGFDLPIVNRGVFPQHWSEARLIELNKEFSKIEIAI